MMSEVYSISTQGEHDHILDEFEAFAKENGCTDKQAMTIRLLSEETMSMLNNVIRFFGGQMWIEKTTIADKDEYDINVKLRGAVGYTAKEELLSVVDGKNAANVGILGKISGFLTDILTYEDDLSDENLANLYPMMAYGMGGITGDVYLNTWSLVEYQKRLSQKEKESEWYGLEKSIIINMADDVVIGVKGKEVTMSVKKTFPGSGKE